MTAHADDPRPGLGTAALTSASDFNAPLLPAAQAPAREGAGRDLVVREALEVSRLTVTRMAEELGIPRATLEAYRLGTRRMPPAARLRLAAYLNQHADTLRRIAQLLNTLT